MKKYVYLFELDSVRNTDREIELGLKALYNEVTWNGNVVVLTFNQLVDSRAFFSLLADDRNYQDFIDLFESGALRISRYGDIRTISQYLLDSLKSKKKFVYSGWPLRSTQDELIALIERSLTYSDLSEIKDWINVGKNNDLQVKDLFVEKDPASNVQALPVKQCTDILEQLYGLIKTVLRLSGMHDIYIPPKENCAGRKLLDFLKFIDLTAITSTDFTNIVRSLGKVSYLDKDERKALENFNPSEASDWFAKAISLIKKTNCFNTNNDNRSDYVDELFEDFYKDKNEKDKNELKFDKPIYQLAEAIVKLAYNYVCEASICDVSKHYNENDLGDAINEKCSFKCDFLSRLVRYFWLIGDWNKRFLCDKAHTFEKYNGAIPLFCRSVRFAKYIRRDLQTRDTAKLLPRYESDQRGAFVHKLSIIWKLVGNSVQVLLCFGVVALIEIISQKFQNCQLVEQLLIRFHDWAASIIILQRFHDWLPWLPCGKLCRFLYFIGLIIVVQIVTKWIKKTLKKFKRFNKFDFLSLSEAVEKLGIFLFDFIRIMGFIMFRIRPKTYFNSVKINSVPKHVFIQSDAMRKYIKLRENPKMEKLFAPSPVYPLAIAQSDEHCNKCDSIIVELGRLEEIYGCRFGVVYESKYNSIIVDPVKKDGGGYFPYERVIPKAGDGVVALTVCNGKYVLLRQYRHAPRTEVLSFPRGFAEENFTDKDNVAKELNEELHVTPNDIVSIEMLGRVFPDSGILATCASVWLVTVSRYAAVKNHEGILGTEELDEEKFCNYIREGKITDGFTLSAYVLYKTHRSNH